MSGFYSSAPGFSAAAAISKKLHAAGFKSALVGGSVRDILLGRTPSDFDLVTSARPEEICRVFPEAKLVGKSFGVTIIRTEGIDTEVASARSERFYLDGRHPEQIAYTTDFALDAQRRDFTVNALMYDLNENRLLDYTGGVADLHAGILRAVGDPEARFKEDYLRLLRAVRFAAKLNFQFAPDLFAALKNCSGSVTQLSAERIFAELDMMFTGKYPDRALRLLEKSAILEKILPEIAILRHVSQPPQFHPEGDVLEHTTLMLSRMTMPNRKLAWSILLHDVGKTETRTVDPDGRIRFFGHENRGAVIAENICRRLKMPVADMECCIHAIANHMRFASVMEMKQSKLRRLIGETDFNTELELHRLDCICSNGLIDGYNYLLDAMSEFSDSNAALPPPLVRGRDLIQNNIKPQIKFKRVLDAVYERQLSGEFPDRETALKAALEMFDSPEK